MADPAKLERLKRLTDLLDSRWRIPGTPWRIGVDGIASIIPGIGDTATAAISAYIIWEARRLGVPRTMLARMIMNAGVDWAVGSIPILGTVFDIGFKANTMNLKLLLRHLDDVVEP